MMGTPVVEHGKQRWQTVNGTRTIERTFYKSFGFEEDEVERRKASYTNGDATKVSTRVAPSPPLNFARFCETQNLVFLVRQYFLMIYLGIYIRWITKLY